MSKSKLSQTQIVQNVFDDNLDALRFVNADPSSGGATEVTAQAIKVAVESIDTKTPAAPATAANQTDTNTKLDTVIAQTDAVEASLSSIDSKASTLISQTDAVEGSLASLDTKSPAQVSGRVPVEIGIAGSVVGVSNPVATHDSNNLMGVARHDTITMNFTGATSDVYSYRVGGVSGTVVSTVTINYTDVTKAVQASVVRT